MATHDPPISTTNSSDSEPLNKSQIYGRANVFARLQSLLPAAPSNSTSQSPTFAEPSSQRSSLLPKFLKVKITTWNMHESLPKGDLIELLGEVTPVNPLEVNRPPLTSIPQLSPDANHPYHVIVVAGQECPSQSGLPLGLGAGFKLIDKDKDKETSLEPESIPPYGWTAILEDWYCHARSAHVIDRKRGLRNFHSVPGAPIPTMHSTPDLKRQSMSKSQPELKGPYEILIKERMMGLYLAVFIHRDIKHLVRGTSKSSVTAGLIGGRVGNKGGVGISINLDGTTLLFINAHLAAHEGKVMHRLHDLHKIKSGLAIEDYLHQDDPRVMKEDLTDRFDYSFIFGDLNFRLDISRLHADWLISRREYAQALAFDQLRAIMQTKEAFVGFNEAPINFPPTFKYDVLRTIKRRKTKLVRIGKDNHLNDSPLVETDEKDREIEDEDGGDEGEVASMASSAYTSVHSKIDQDAEDDDDHGFFMRSKTSRASTGNLININKGWSAFAAHKTRMKFAAFLSPRKGSPSPGPSPIGWANKGRRSSLDEGSLHSASKTAPTTPSLNQDASSMKSSLLPEKLGPSLARSDATPTISLTEEKTDQQDKGVYDTSSKQRVPSWCDRILWKSTVEPDADPDEYDATDFATSRVRNRVGYFIAQAFRKRSRKSSYSSSVDVSSPPPPPKDEIFTRSPLMKSPITQTPISRRPNSIDGLPRLPLVHSLTRPATDEKSKLRRSTSLVLPRSKTIPTRSKTVPVAMETIQTPAPAPVPLPLSSYSLPPLLPPKDIRNVPSKWRLSFLPFFNRSQSTLAQDKPPAPDSPTMQVKPKRRKGDVVCLSYDTLDDRGMRRLEGRSDHRPVIGNFALYL